MLDFLRHSPPIQRACLPLDMWALRAIYLFHPCGSIVQCATKTAGVKPAFMNADSLNRIEIPM